MKYDKNKSMIKIKESNIENLFKKLEKNNKEDIIKEIILSLKEKEIYELAPEKIKNDESFLKEALNNKVLLISDLSEKKKIIINKNEYLNLIKTDQRNAEDTKMWKDKETIIEAIKISPSLISVAIREGYITIKEDIEKIIELFNKSESIQLRVMSRNLNKDYVKEIEKRDPELIIKILKEEEKIYDFLPDNKKTEIKYVKALLESNIYNGYYVVKNELKKIKDKEIAILALEKTNEAVKHIYQPYQKIIKDNKVSSNYANFLRLYWLHEGLQNNLEIKETKTSKLKI